MSDCAMSSAISGLRWRHIDVVDGLRLVEKEVEVLAFAVKLGLQPGNDVRL